MPCASFRTVAEVLQDLQLAARGTFGTVRDGSGPFQIAQAPFRMPGATKTVRERIPDLGAETEAVLGSLLGYSAAQIAACSTG